MLSSANFAVSRNIGDPFPLFMYKNTLESKECVYFKIDCERDFALDKLHHDVVIIEFLNVYCHTCREQVDVFNNLYLSIEKDLVLSENVCLLGIAVGNSQEEVREFKEKFGAFYPILSDPQKTIFRLMGSIRGTPHTYILKREETYFIIDYHAGGVSSIERYLSTIKFALRGIMYGVELGNKVHDYAFISKKKSFNEKSFQGKKVIFYFPIDKEYPLEIDIRKPENQIEVLQKIKEEFPDINIVIFKSPGFPADLLVKTKFPDIYTVEIPHAKVMQKFSSPDRSTLYYINQFGRIAFKSDSVTLHNFQDIIEGKEYVPTPDISEVDIIEKIEEHIESLSMEVSATQKLKLENNNLIFVTTVSSQPEAVYLFSRLESRPSLCDVCSDSHFIYILDQEGMIKSFIPIHLTKLWNVSWTEDDIKKIKKDLVGRSIFEEFPFHPKTDAVTTATMTSSLIFEALNEGKDIFGEFSDYKFRSRYWQQLCFKNICTIKHLIEQKQKATGFQGSDHPAIEKVLNEIKMPECPLQGKYIVLGSDMLCSVHGLNTQGCGE